MEENLSSFAIALHGLERQGPIGTTMTLEHADQLLHTQIQFQTTTKIHHDKSTN
jgi:hypothetical protein